MDDVIVVDAGAGADVGAAAAAPQVSESALHADAETLPTHADTVEILGRTYRAKVCGMRVETCRQILIESKTRLSCDFSEFAADILKLPWAKALFAELVRTGADAYAFKPDAAEAKGEEGEAAADEGESLLQPLKQPLKYDFADLDAVSVGLLFVTYSVFRSDD